MKCNRKCIFTIYCVIFAMILSICGGIIQNNGTIYAQNENISLTSKSAYLVDYNSNTVMYDNNSKARLPIASMVKMMTLLLTYEAIDDGVFTLDTMIPTTENASSMGGSQVFIDPYVEYKASDLIKSVVMSSANDASVALAEYISGSEEAFVEKMNKRAKELNMEDTVYVNCTGLPAPEQYSCAYDSAIVLKEVMKHPHYHTISSIWMDELVHPSGRKTELVNTNKLVRYYKGCDCGKTGSTNEAGYCLTTSAIKGDFRVICVVIGSKSGQDRFKDATTLLNYAFNCFENKTIVDSNVCLKDCEVLQGKQKIAQVFAKDSFYGLCKKGDKTGYDISFEIKNLKAPLSCGQVVGKLFVSQNGKLIKEIDLVIKDSIEKLGFIDNIKQIASNW